MLVKTVRQRRTCSLLQCGHCVHASICLKKYLPFPEVHIFYSWSKMNYESTIAFVGQWRYFQKMIFFLLCTSMVPNGLLAFFIVFVGDTPDHHCQIPNVNLTQEWLNTTIPKEVISIFKTYFTFSICCFFFTFDSDPSGEALLLLWFMELQLFIVHSS